MSSRLFNIKFEEKPMSIPRDIVFGNEGLGAWSILTAYRGSLAHGMWMPKSDPNSIDDKDVMAVCVPPMEYYYGLREYGSRGTKEIRRDEWDIVIYEAKKFISLLAQGNPNVLSMLWLRDNFYIFRADAGQMLIDSRILFSGRHVYYPFVGYAKAQLYKMTHQAYSGYMGTKRKALVDQFGYDVKNAAHLIRLLRMAVEFLTDGIMNVYRFDAPELLEIKRGEWELDKVTAEADRLFKLAEEAHMRSSLPVGPDMDEINKLSVNVIRCALEDWVIQ